MDTTATVSPATNNFSYGSFGFKVGRQFVYFNTVAPALVICLFFLAGTSERWHTFNVLYALLGFVCWWIIWAAQMSANRGSYIPTRRNAGANDSPFASPALQRRWFWVNQVGLLLVPLAAWLARLFGMASLAVAMLATVGFMVYALSLIRSPDFQRIR